MPTWAIMMGLLALSVSSVEIEDLSDTEVQRLDQSADMDTRRLGEFNGENEKYPG